MAPGIGVKGNRFMKKKIKYSDEKIGEVGVVKDFLPTGRIGIQRQYCQSNTKLE